MKKSAMNLFRRLPDPVRRAVVHGATPSYTVGAVAVLRREDGRVAFVDQRHSPGWALPGGLVGRGEPADVALAREVEEELGIRLDVASLPVPFAAVNSDVRRVDVVYCLPAPPRPLAAGEDVEVLRVGWFPLEALPDVTESTLDILRAVQLL